MVLAEERTRTRKDARIGDPDFLDKCYRRLGIKRKERKMKERKRKRKRLESSRYLVLESRILYRIQRHLQRRRKERKRKRKRKM